MRRASQVVLAVFLVFGLGGCDAPPAAKELVQAKHVELYIFVQRINDPDPTKRPTPDQMKDVITAMAKDMESMDSLLNNWKPDSGMSRVDINGKVSDVQKMVDKLKSHKTIAEKEPDGNESRNE